MTGFSTPLDACRPMSELTEEAVLFGNLITSPLEGISAIASALQRFDLACVITTDPIYQSDRDRIIFSYDVNVAGTLGQIIEVWLREESGWVVGVCVGVCPPEVATRLADHIALRSSGCQA